MGNEYTFRVRGRLSPDILAALHPLRPVVLGPETELQGAIADQAALHGIIARLESLGLELLALQQLPDNQPASSPPTGDVGASSQVHGGFSAGR